MVPTNKLLAQEGSFSILVNLSQVHRLIFWRCQNQRYIIILEYIHLIDWATILSEWFNKLKSISILVFLILLFVLVYSINFKRLIIVACNEAIFLAVFKPSKLPRDLRFCLVWKEIFPNEFIVSQKFRCFLYFCAFFSFHFIIKLERHR